MEFSEVLYLLRHIFFIFVLLWGLFSILNLLHKGLPILWRFIVVLIYFIFIFFYYSLLRELYLTLLNNPLLFFNNLYYELILIVNYLDVLIYFLWPFMLIYSFFSFKEKKSLENLKILIIITLLFWIFLFVRNNDNFKTIWNDFVLQNILSLIKNSK